jgi:hypothetical protein
MFFDSLKKIYALGCPNSIVKEGFESHFFRSKTSDFFSLFYGGSNNK